jgi:hypothetical protein
MLAVGLEKNETNPSRKKNGPHGQKLGDIARNIFGFCLISPTGPFKK